MESHKIYRKYFSNSHTFLLEGHGSEIIRPGLRKRFELNEGEYCAISNSVGEVGLIEPQYVTEFFGSKYNKIKIPYNDSIINDPKLGFIDSIYKLDRFDDKDRVKIDYFKIYRPRINKDDTRRFKYTVPNLNYSPTMIFANDPNYFYDFGMGDNLIYRGASYTNIKLSAIAIQSSGIIGRNTPIENIGIHWSAIFKNEKEFNDNLFNAPYTMGYKNKINRSNIQKPWFIQFFDYNKIFVCVDYSADNLKRTIKDIFEAKDTDPLTYDFLRLIKASYKNSILSFDDICMHIVCKSYFDKKDTTKQSIFSEIYERIRLFLSESEPINEEEIISIQDLTDDLFLKNIETGYLDRFRTYIQSYVTLHDIIHMQMKLETVFKFLKLKIKYDSSNPIMVIPLICRNLAPNFPSSKKTVKEYRLLSRPTNSKTHKRHKKMLSNGKKTKKLSIKTKTHS